MNMNRKCSDLTAMADVNGEIYPETSSVKAWVKNCSAAETACPMFSTNTLEIKNDG